MVSVSALVECFVGKHVMRPGMCTHSTLANFEGSVPSLVAATSRTRTKSEPAATLKRMYQLEEAFDVAVICHGRPAFRSIETV